MEVILTVINTVGVCQQQIPQQHFCRHHFCRAIQIHSRSLSRRLSPPQSPPLQRPSNSPCWRLGWRPVTPYNSRSTKLRRSKQTKGREVQRLLLQTHLQLRGDGDVGRALLVPQAAGEVLYTHRRLRTRSLKTIFGPVEIHRMGYSRNGGPSIYPLDQILALPARSFSYELQRRFVKAAAHKPFHESVEAIADLTGVSVPKRRLEEILQDAAKDFDAFYQQRTPR